MSKVTVEHFLGESFLGSEMIRKGALWCTGSGADITDASALVTGLKHHLQPGVKDIFAKGRFTHEEVVIRTCVLVVKSFFYISTARHISLTSERTTITSLSDKFYAFGLNVLY